VRGKAEEEENKTFDALTAKVQKIIDEETESSYETAGAQLSEMRRLFFTVAWRSPDYIRAWLHHLRQEAWLFADQEEFTAMVAEGEKLDKAYDYDALRELVMKLLDKRVSLGASDAVNDLATIVKG
jgi:hypothetical protein